MESKKLSFNWKMIKRDILRSWPIWVITSCFYLLLVTGLFSLMSYMDDDKDRIAGDLVRRFMLPVSGYISPILGLIVGVYVFSYLSSRKKHHFYDFLPMSRMSMFATRFMLGFIIMMIPSLVIYLVELLQAAIQTGYFLIADLSAWLLINCISNLFWLAFATLFMVLCGSKIMAGICYVAFTFVGVILVYTLALFNSFMYIGFSSLGRVSNIDLINIGIFSPLEFIYDEGVLHGSGSWFNQYFDIIKLLIVFVAFVILLVFSAHLYKKRLTERTGDNIVFPLMKTICACIFTLMFTIEGTFFIIGITVYEQEGLAHYSSYRILIIAIIIVLGLLGYMIASMIIEKKFRVFKKNILKASIFTSIMVVFMILYMHDAFGIEKYVPEENEVDTVGVTSGQFLSESVYSYVQYDYDNDDYIYPTTMSDENKKVIIGLHQMIIDNMDEVIESYKNIDESYYNSIYGVYDLEEYSRNVKPVRSCVVYFTYYVKNESMYREYYIKPEGKLFEQVKAYLKAHPETFRKGDSEPNYYYGYMNTIQ